ncbi:dephospho-CoA kinase [Pseudarthrobacter sp. CCNWLW207]|uniref:dephospho-CoA kinase n=1 Tax=Pseudarthrobacter sp. CCNWLW207 TaxID=3127468 RepID=UPI0030786695
MLKIGLTGGIASGKSVVASRLAELGAVLVDADALARHVVEPGTPGLARVVEAFGQDMLDGAGRLDRARLGAVVFGNDAQRAVLNGIVHPLVREAAAGILATAPDGAVVVQDIPLLVETGQGSDFHLVVVVDAPDDVRVRRMQENRGMTAEEARSRMAAQASRDERLAAADVVLDNSGTVDALLAQVDGLWQGRLAPFARNIMTATPAERPGGPVLHGPRSEWPRDAERVMARIRSALRKHAGADGIAPVGLDHIGSTSVPGLDAKDVLDLQLTVPALVVAAQLEPVLAAAGYPRVPAISTDVPKPMHPDPSAWAKRFHASADPGHAVNLHVRVAGSPGWRFALCFRDWLRAVPDAAADYLALKRRLSEVHASDPTTAAYAAAKEAWFAAAEGPMERWAAATGWAPPSYPVRR